MKKIIITEEQLKRIVDNQIDEQGLITPGMVHPVASQGRPSPRMTDIQRKYPCINKDFVVPFQELLEKKSYDKQILKVAVGVIGRESSFASGKRYNVMKIFKRSASLVGINTSVGPAQMTPDTAGDFGLSRSDLITYFGALNASYLYILKQRNLATQRGYTNQPSTLGSKGTGDATLDIAIASYNSGAAIINQWCVSPENPNLGVHCNKITKGEKKQLPNYIPNYKTQRIDGVDTSTHGYVTEVASYYKKMTC